MPLYECVFIVRQDVPSTQVETLAATYADMIREHKGTVGKTEQWGLRTLAYRINKNKKGHYVLMHIDATAETVAEMERNMTISEDILRFMTIKVDAFEEAPSAILRREERSERGPSDRGGDRGDRGDRGGGYDRGPRRSGSGRPDATTSSEGEAA